MMAAKDARVGLMNDLLRNIGPLKALGWEGVLADKVRRRARATALTELPAACQPAVLCSE